MRKKADELVFTHGFLDKRRLRNTRFAEELSPRKKKLHLPRNEKIQSWCESTGQWELRSRNELRIYASCAPCKHGRAQDGWECWSMGHPCSIQRGLARRLCILLVCTDLLSALAPKLQEVMGRLNTISRRTKNSRRQRRCDTNSRRQRMSRRQRR